MQLFTSFFIYRDFRSIAYTSDQMEGLVGLAREHRGDRFRLRESQPLVLNIGASRTVPT